MTRYKIQTVTFDGKEIALNTYNTKEDYEKAMAVWLSQKPLENLPCTGAIIIRCFVEEAHFVPLETHTITK